MKVLGVWVLGGGGLLTRFCSLPSALRGIYLFIYLYVYLFIYLNALEIHVFYYVLFVR